MHLGRSMDIGAEMESARIKLDPQAIEAVARRVVELLERRGVGGGTELVDAAELARRLGIERSWVYTHAIELGAVKLGSGRKPLSASIRRSRLGCCTGVVRDRRPTRPPARVSGRVGRGGLKARYGCFRSRAAGRVDLRRSLIQGGAMARKSAGQVVELERQGGRTFALRFRAYGKRRYLTLGTSAEGWTRTKAEEELANVLADVRRGMWKPSEPREAAEPTPEPTFHEFASEWLETRRHEFAARTVEDYELALTHHLLPFFKDHRLSEITAQEVDRYKAAKVRERELGQVERPLSNRTINKTLTRLGQILDAAVRYELIEHNPVKGKVEKLKEAEPKRARLTGEQVQVLLRAAGPHRALLATAIMAGGLRVSELTHLRWRDVDLRQGVLNVAVSKTAAGVRQVVLDPELAQLLREHKIGVEVEPAR